MTDDGLDYDFDGAWFERTWKDDFVSGHGDLGAAYREDGFTGPRTGEKGVVGVIGAVDKFSEIFCYLIIIETRYM